MSITERITYDYDGHFEGAWRDIPSRFGELVDRSSVRVSEGQITYRPGGTTTLGEAGPPDSFAVGPLDGAGTRIVWRYSADDTQKTFTISYRMTRLVKVYRDFAELNLRVWATNGRRRSAGSRPMSPSRRPWISSPRTSCVSGDIRATSRDRPRASPVWTA